MTPLDLAIENGTQDVIDLLCRSATRTLLQHQRAVHLFCFYTGFSARRVYEKVTIVLPGGWKTARRGAHVGTLLTLFFVSSHEKRRHGSSALPLHVGVAGRSCELGRARCCMPVWVVPDPTTRAHREAAHAGHVAPCAAVTAVLGNGKNLPNIFRCRFHGNAENRQNGTPWMEAAAAAVASASGNLLWPLLDDS